MESENRNEPRKTLTPHSLHMDRRKSAEITGVSDVCSFHETEIVLKVDSGLMIVTGQELHVGKLLLDEGRLHIDGRIDGIVYEAPKADLHRLWPWGRRRA